MANKERLQRREHRSIALEEFIGKHIKIIDSKDLGMIGIEGIVVDETKNTFTILSNGKEKIIPKAPNTFIFEKKYMIKGTFINIRHVDRIKKLKRKI